MKKSIIVLALALLMVGSVFAANKPLTAQDETTAGDSKTVLTSAGISTTANEPKDTTVRIKLAQYPKYMTAITTGNYDGSDDAHTITNTNYTTVQHQELINMTVNKDTWVLNETTTDAYFVTFFAYENTQNVQFTLTLDDNLKLVETAGSAATASPSVNTKDIDSGNQKEIRYQMTINGIDGNGNESTSGSVTLHSKDKDSTIVRKVASTNLIGYSTFGSYSFTLKGEGTDTVQNNIAGLYESTITLKIASY